MKYAELIQFDPIESVVQLKEADAESEARRLVETFVISDRMAEQLRDLVVPQLQFTAPADNRGLMIVGNYGTGKSHLMAVLSAVAEHEGLADALTDDSVAARAATIAGRFRVIRAEIGSTTMSLRDILCSILEDRLEAMGVSYQFPDTSERHENKSAFLEMMAAFQAEFPDQGLLLVLDELLDYLRSRRDQELSLDLSFLREVGEVCKGTRFRFLAGVQESIFDNPRFHFVADTLRRVKDRFEQVRIAREDVAHVVCERLLKKTPEQRARIQGHLAPFAPLYGSMNERMDEFVRMFPVHPAYLDTFERVSVAEKREVLRTLSNAIRGLLDEEVPGEEPGVLSFDSYWEVLRENPSFRSVQEIKDVIDKSVVLEDRIQQAFTRPQYRPAALRIIHALSVHRLTTGDIYAPLGATAEELRDDLCLVLPVPEREAEFLKTLVETVLREIVKAVSGQFLSCNQENDQYYLDLKKDVDFDSLIARKAESLDDDQLDRYYFDALRRVVLEDPEMQPFRTGYRIWEHEVEWRERKAKRSGYLFFGTPSERCNTQPPRDYYLYFLQPFEQPAVTDKEPDEVFFRLAHRDDEFHQALKLYAGAKEQAGAASGSNKSVYEQKAAGHLRTLTDWLTRKLTTACEVTYQGLTQTLAERVQGKLPGGTSRATPRDFIETAASVCLGPEFEDKSPDYPTFSITITRKTRPQAAQEALRWIAGSVKSKTGAAVLDALELLDGEQLRPRASKYAQHVLELLEKKKQGQVLTRGELVQTEKGEDYWTRFRLEGDFLAVTLASLVHSGDLVISLPGKRLDAASVETFAKLSIEDLKSFKHVERPKDLPLGALQDLFELLDIPRGLLVDPAKRDDAVVKLQTKVATLLEQAVLAQGKLTDLELWGGSLLTEQERSDWASTIAQHKQFLESLQTFNSPGKLKNFPHDSGAIQAQRAALERIREVQALVALTQKLGPLTAYLGRAEGVLEGADSWVAQLRETRADLLGKLADPKQRASSTFQRSLEKTLRDIKAAYRDRYLGAHRERRLGPDDDKKKTALARDPRLTTLQKLSIVEMMPAQQLHEVQDRLSLLKPCFSLTGKDLEADPVCPHCSFRPVDEKDGPTQASDELSRLDDALDELLTTWTHTLHKNLGDPMVRESLDLLGDSPAKKALADFLESEELPDKVSDDFVRSLQEVLSGLDKVILDRDGLHQELIEGGIPCTVGELEGRFTRHLSRLTKGKDATKVRIVIA